MQLEREPISYALDACETMMLTWKAEELPPKGSFHYHQGVFLSGVYKTYELTGYKKLFDYMKAYVDARIDEDGSIHEYRKDALDDLQPGILLYPLYKKTKDVRYKKALDTIAQNLRDYPKTAEGSFWHAVNCPEQLWLDGLYMGGPVTTQYGEMFGVQEFLDLTVRQIFNMEKHTKDEKTGLWKHACDLSRQAPWADPQTGCSEEFWGRSIGWVPVAILEDLDHMKKTQEGGEEVVRILCDLLKAVAKYQDPEDGRWYQVVNKGGEPGNWLENSCSCLFSAALFQAVRQNFLDPSYLDIAWKGYEGVINSLTYGRNGIEIGNVCIGTGVGDYQFYCDRPTVTNDLHGVGAFLIMCTEAQRVLNDERRREKNQ